MAARSVLLGDTGPSDLYSAESNRETESRAREAVVDAWRRALHRMRERRAAQDRADPGR